MVLFCGLGMFTPCRCDGGNIDVRATAIDGAVCDEWGIVNRGAFNVGIVDWGYVGRGTGDEMHLMVAWLMEMQHMEEAPSTEM